jgi:hypothetical protein
VFVSTEYFIMPKKAVKKIVKRLVKPSVTQEALPAQAIVPVVPADFNLARQCVRVTPPPIFTMLTDAAKREREVESIHDGLFQSALVGIPFPSFVCEVMFHESVFPLGRLICLDGMQETLKSGLLFEMMRWFIAAEGSGHIVDTEGKSTQDWGQSIVGHEQFQFFRYTVTEAFEDAQQCVQGMLKLARGMFVKKGKFAPLLLGLDSTTGVLTNSERQKIHREGFASKGYSSVANVSSRWLPSLIKDLMDLPIALVVIRHERERAVTRNGVDTGIKVPEPKGAGEWSFHAYKTFHIQRDARSEIDLVHMGGRNIIICPKKGMSLGLRIPLRVTWQDVQLRDEETGETKVVQHTRFCWDRSTFALLTNMTACGLAKRYQAGVHDVLGALNAKMDRVICKPLGLDTAVTCEVFSQALYHPSNANVLKQLRQVLGLKDGYIFTGSGKVSFDDAKEHQRLKLLHEQEAIRSGKLVIAQREKVGRLSEEDEIDIDEEKNVDSEQASETDEGYDGF